MFYPSALWEQNQHLKNLDSSMTAVTIFHIAVTVTLMSSPLIRLPDVCSCLARRDDE